MPETITQSEAAERFGMTRTSFKRREHATLVKFWLLLRSHPAYFDALEALGLEDDRRSPFLVYLWLVTRGADAETDVVAANRRTSED
jgi:hypothetical protein